MTPQGIGDELSHLRRIECQNGHRMIADELRQLDQQSADYASRFVDALLNAAKEIRASDLHLHPTAEGLDISWRIDGVLQTLGSFPAGVQADIVTRLKVLAELLTYVTDRPQEGRVRGVSDVELRVSTFPTLHGERAVVRQFGALGRYEQLGELGLPEDTLTAWKNYLQETSGALLVCGPAGSGKTTTAYASLRAISGASQTKRNVVTLEDPIESEAPFASQSQVNSAVGFDFATGVRSLMRQDPEVIMIGEIRDAETATAAFQASLTGHLVISTFHAGNSGEAVRRLIDMGIEPYMLRSGLLATLSQRLLRKLCACAVECADNDKLGLPVSSARSPVGCEQCHQTGYSGRLLLTERMSPRSVEIGTAINKETDAHELQQAAIAGGMTPLREATLEAIRRGDVSPAEARRVFGFLEQW